MKKNLFLLIFISLLSSQESRTMSYSEFSFILKPSSLGGIGVFAAHDISAGTPLFTNDYVLRTCKIKDIPEAFIKYCIYINDEECICPEHFDRMEIGWYINHSNDPNIESKNSLECNKDNSVTQHTIYVIKDIKSGDEILINYNYLNEPEHLKESYYKENINQESSIAKTPVGQRYINFLNLFITNDSNYISEYESLFAPTVQKIINSKIICNNAKELLHQMTDIVTQDKVLCINLLELIIGNDGTTNIIRFEITFGDNNTETVISILKTDESNKIIEINEVFGNKEEYEWSLIQL